MLEKINYIKNIGIFKDYSLNRKKHGDVKFSKINIIYGKNGSGKSTIVEILRSLREDNADIIKGRKSIVTSSNQIANIKIDNDIYVFNGRWNKTYTNIEIFDQQYVHENIYLGNEISPENRRNQFNIMIGKDNIKINSELIEINNKLRELNKKIKELEEELRIEIRGGLPFEDFISLDTSVDLESINNNLYELYKMRDSYKNSLRIYNLESLKKLDLPELDMENFIDMLKTNNYNLGTQVDKDIKDYIEEKGINENWIATGFNKVVDNKCPFCNQNLYGSEIFDLYKLFYDKNINEYKRLIDSFQKIIKESFSETTALKYNILLQNHLRIIKEIKHYIEDIDLPQYDQNGISDKIVSLFNRLTSLMAKKTKEPFNFNIFDDEIKTLLNEYNEIIDLLKILNLQINEINEIVDRYKRNLKAININDIENQINYYLNLKVIRGKNIKYKIKKLNDFRSNVNILNLRKANLKTRLANINRDKINEFNRILNDILIGFKASFKVTYTLPKFYVRGTEAEYNIIINDQEVSARVAKKNIIKNPNFNNILSEGDKSLLALAYFLANIRLNVDMANMIILLDDPTNYCDITKKRLIAEQIANLSLYVKQIIILTHDSDFSRKIWELNNGKDLTGFYLDYFDESANIVTRYIYRERKL